MWVDLPAPSMPSKLMSKPLMSSALRGIQRRSW
jgi:hypothetical protein